MYIIIIGIYPQFYPALIDILIIDKPINAFPHDT